MKQPTLFDLEAFTKSPVPTPLYDPAWDEVEIAPQHSEYQPAKGDWVLLDRDWMDKCLKVATKEWRKNYEYKSTEDLKAQVFLVHPDWKGAIYVTRNGQAVYVPKEYYSVLKTEDQDTDGECWNPAHFGEVKRKADGDQLTIFYDDSEEPPDPDDYQNLDDYNEAWREWELRVGGQNSQSQLPCESVGGQVASSTLNICTPHSREVTYTTKKTAPQHDTHWVEKYWVERSGNRYWYYRYCWMVGRKIHRRYIGSVDSPKSRFKKEEVENAIADGQRRRRLKI